MLDSLPDAEKPFRAYKSRCLKISRRRRGQFVHGKRAGPEHEHFPGTK
ncbi:Uncharacterised protein [Salmonella enterica]|nr:Uncharacterised protein [Salmonella enterica]